MRKKTTFVYKVNMSENIKLPDTKQTSWQLSAIQLTGVTSLPVLATSIIILQYSSFSSAIITLVIGNILLWLIRLGIMAMSFRGRKSTLDISKDFVGRIGSYPIAIVLLASTLAWFVAQTTIASNALTYLLPIDEGPQINLFIQMSVILGIISTLLCMEGIVVLRWLSILTLPILLFAFLCVLIEAPKGVHHIVDSKLSLAGLPLVIGTSLGVTADLPTFFRHSRSWKDSFRALIIIQIISLALGIGGLFLGSVIEPWFGVKEASNFALNGPMLRASLIALVFFSAIATNVANVYSASVGWELVAPALAGRKEYLILGLGLTTIFILVANVVSMDFLIELTDSALVNLCLILILGYIISRIKKQKPKSFEKASYFIGWLLATAFNFLQYSHILLPKFSPLLAAIAIILLISAASNTLNKLKNAFVYR